MDTPRCLLEDLKLNKRFWLEVVKSVAYLKNRTLVNITEKQTPYEIFMDKKPNTSNFKFFGSRVFVRVSKNKRQSKWDKET